MSTRTSKKQQARELAMQALAEKLAKQEKVKAATQQAFLAQAEFDGVRQRFASALQELEQLGEPQTWMRESFGLTASELRSLLALNVDAGDEEQDSEPATEEAEENTGEHDSGDYHQ
ncbi:hypothetical protein [Corynebacterium mayonis]|uniref:hypothetical protein n=1 Tax=Corynebacterium mayonis TaxID=3062461 RepID=UPI0031404C93